MISLATFLILSITCVLASISPDYWDKVEVARGDYLTKLLNYQRLDYDATPLIYNYRENNKFSLYKSVYGNNWFSDKNDNGWKLSSPTMKDVNRTVELNAAFLFNFATFETQGQENWSWLFSYNHQTNLKKLLAKGANCYDFFKCSETKFTNYISCMDKDCVGAENLVFPKIINPRLWVITSVNDDLNTHVYGRITIPTNDRFY